MPDSLDPRDPQGADEGRRQDIEAADWAALVDYAERRATCDATGESLDPAESVAMTVGTAPGVSTFAMVTAAHWDGGQGALSAADPRVDPDVLDGRRVFRLDQQSAGRRPSGVHLAPGAHPRGPGMVQQPRSTAPSSGPSPRPS
jgi:hypothetical protein